MPKKRRDNLPAFGQVWEWARTFPLMLVAPTESTEFGSRGTWLTISLDSDNPDEILEMYGLTDDPKERAEGWERIS